MVLQINFQLVQGNYENINKTKIVICGHLGCKTSYLSRRHSRHFQIPKLEETHTSYFTSGQILGAVRFADNQRLSIKDHLNNCNKFQSSPNIFEVQQIEALDHGYLWDLFSSRHLSPYCSYHMTRPCQINIHNLVFLHPVLKWHKSTMSSAC